VSALVGLIAAFGGYSLGGLVLHGTESLRWGIAVAIFFIIVGLFEEFLFRGYTQYTLGDSIGFWPGSCCAFMLVWAVHLGNPGEGPVGAAACVRDWIRFRVRTAAHRQSLVGCGMAREF